MICRVLALKYSGSESNDTHQNLVRELDLNLKQVAFKLSSYLLKVTLFLIQILNYYGEIKMLKAPLT